MYEKVVNLKKKVKKVVKAFWIYTSTAKRKPRGSIPGRHL